MKKVFSMLLSAVLACTMLAVPVSAIGDGVVRGDATTIKAPILAEIMDSGDLEGSAEAVALAQLLCDMQSDICIIEFDNHVKLLDNLTLEETIVIPEGENVVLDVDDFDLTADGDFPAIYVPENASLTVEGRRGKVIGGTNAEEGNCAIKNDGELAIDSNSLEIIGGGTTFTGGSSGGGSLPGGGASGGSGGGASGGGASGGSGGGGGHLGGKSAGSGGGATGAYGGPQHPAEFDIDTTEIPGTIVTQNGGSGVVNNGKLHLAKGKIVGGWGSESVGSAITGKITDGQCIADSDDDLDYEYITAATTTKQFVYCRRGTTAEAFLIMHAIGGTGEFDYNVSYDSEEEKYYETITMLSDIKLPSFDDACGLTGGYTTLDTNNYKLNLLPSDEEEFGTLLSTCFEIRGNGVINGNISCLYGVIENVTINGDLVSQEGLYSPLVINSGKINGNIHCYGSTLEINGGRINGLIEAFETNVTINGGVVDGGTNSWPSGKDYGTIWVRNNGITMNGGTVKGWTDNKGKDGQLAITVTGNSSGSDPAYLTFNGGTITGGIGTETSAPAVDGLMKKDGSAIIKESADGKVWSVLETETSDKTYLKAGPEYCITVIKGKAYLSDDLDTPIFEAEAGDEITIIADSDSIDEVFQSWNITGVTPETKTNRKITFTMPDGNVSCKAIFKDDSWYRIIANDTAALMDGEDYTLTMAPVSYDKILFVAVNDLTEGLALDDCSWNGSTNRITFTLGDKTVSYKEGDYRMIVRDDQRMVDCKDLMGRLLDEDFWIIGDETKVVGKKKTEENTVTVTVSGINGTTTGGGDYYKGSSVTVTAKPNQGYQFNGWYHGDSRVTKNTSYTFKAEEDTTVYASFSEIDVSGGGTSSGGGGGNDFNQNPVYTIKFNVYGGSAVTSQKVGKGSYVKEPYEPIKNGYIFAGWYTDEACTTPYNFLIPVTGSFILHAKWVENISSGTTTQNPEELSFKDVSVNDWFYQDVKYVFQNKLMNGVSVNEFAPYHTLTRAMLVTILYRDAKEPAVNKSIPYSDVDMNAYYANAVSWAKQNGIVNGVTESEFAPDSNITREQIATILYRYATYCGYDVTKGGTVELSSYQDVATVSDYALSAMKYAVGNGLINGKTPTTLNPGDYATRAEIAAILHRFKGNK